jgi:hypothetical protein
MKKELLFMTAVIFMATALFVACTEEQQDGDGDNGPRISFTPMEINGQNARKWEQTRASQTEDTDIESFKVSCVIYSAYETFATASESKYYFINESIESDTGQSKYFWPGSEHNLSFFAYTPVSNSLYALHLSQLSEDWTSEIAGKPTYNYTIPLYIDEQLDFMTAEVLDHSGAPTTTPVALTFRHKLSDVRFIITNENTDKAITINSIIMCGMRFKGELENNNWKLSGSRNTKTSNPFRFYVNTNIAAEATVDITGTDNHFMLIPQEVASGRALFVINVTVDGVDKEYTHVLESAFTFVMEKSYTFNISIGPDGMKVDPDTYIVDWEADVRYIYPMLDANYPTKQDQSVDNATADVNDWKP